MWYSILNSPRISETPAVAGNRPTLASEEAHADFAATLRWMGFLSSGQFTTTPSRSTAAVSALLQISLLVMMAVGWDVDYLAASLFSRF
ncbi:hypothetical protein PMI03_00506 [Rhizobium sp. AP16]|nr:hypothetical protein PMI03_00506 [Rhizobium sp. AP16]